MVSPLPAEEGAEAQVEEGSEHGQPAAAEEGIEEKKEGDEHAQQQPTGRGSRRVWGKGDGGRGPHCSSRAAAGDCFQNLSAISG